jgi:molybdopterin adenylyltransferase
LRLNHGKEERRGPIRSAFVLTISDGVADGSRQDESGSALAQRLEALGFAVESAAVPDETKEIVSAVRRAVGRDSLVLTTGGTGLGPRDRTPQALRSLLDYEIPGFGEAMRAHGRTSTPFADLSRSLAGVTGQTLVIAVPGSPRAALESLAAIEPLLEHALATIGGDTHRHPDAGHRRA